jgi:biotin carboxyl carrier protein
MANRRDGVGGGTEADEASNEVSNEVSRMSRDHQAIGRLADELLPALIAKLTASGLGEIEVREGDWKARLRKSAGREDLRRIAGTGGGEAAGPRAGAVRSEPREERAPKADDALPVVFVGATSPAVGIFHPRKDLAAGLAVRAGDKLGHVDVLGVQQDIIVPIDGILGVGLVEAGEAVEYGQELMTIDQPKSDGASGSSATGKP